MKRSQIAIALLATFAAASNSVSLACEKCHARGNSCKTCAKCDEGASAKCDDRGLLDVVDRCAGRIQKSLEGGLGQRSSKCDGGCHTKRQSGEPVCGCEPACGCETHRAAPVPKPVHNHEGIHDHGVRIEPQTPFVVPQPHGGNQTNTNPLVRPPRGTGNSTPAPKPVTKEGQVRPVPQQLPDEAVDPFRDDAASRVRRAPATSIQYQRPVPRYVDQFDPQAANRYRVRVGHAPAQTVQPRAAAQISDFETGQSSRRTAGVQSTFSDLKSPQVVTASSTSGLEPIRSPSAERLPSRAEAQADDRAYYANPLR